MAIRLRGFNRPAIRAAAIAEEWAAQMIVEISKATEATIRTLIAQSLRKGISAYDTARLVRGLVGLTPQQAQAVLSYRERLEESGLLVETLERKVERYADKLLTDRGESIARTEIMDGLNQAQEQGWLEAQAKGLLSENATKVVILSLGACQVCQGIAEEGPVPIGQSFSIEGPPFHTRCECTIAIETP